MICWPRWSRRVKLTRRGARRQRRLVWEPLKPRLLLSADAEILAALDAALAGEAPSIPGIESTIPVSEGSGSSDDTLDTARVLDLSPDETLEIAAAIGDGAFGQADVDLYRVEVATGRVDDGRAARG